MIVRFQEIPKQKKKKEEEKEKTSLLKELKAYENETNSPTHINLL